MKSGAAFLAVAVLLLTSVFYFSHPHGASARRASLIGQPAPDFKLKDLQGNSIQLSSFRGKTLVLNFWASWCGPCKEETPWLVELQNQYGPQGVQVIGVALDDSGSADIARFAEELRINYPVLLGDGNVAEAFGGVQSLPTTFYIKRDGKIAASVLGAIDHDQIERNIKEALAPD